MGLLKVWVGERRLQYLKQWAIKSNVEVDAVVTRMIDRMMIDFPIEIPAQDVDVVPPIVRKILSEYAPAKGRDPGAKFLSIKKVAEMLSTGNYNRNMVHWMGSMGYSQKTIKVKGKGVKGYWVIHKDDVPKYLPQDRDAL